MYSANSRRRWRNSAKSGKNNNFFLKYLISPTMCWRSYGGDKLSSLACLPDDNLIATLSGFESGLDEWSSGLESGKAGGQQVITFSPAGCDRVWFDTSAEPAEGEKAITLQEKLVKADGQWRLLSVVFIFKIIIFFLFFETDSNLHCPLEFGSTHPPNLQ